MDAWRTLQAEMMDQFLADRLTGVQQELLVKSGDVRTELAHLVGACEIDLAVLGTRGRTGIWGFLLGSSVAESVRQQVACPVLTVGPNVVGEGPDNWPQRILVPTGFAPQSLNAITYASWLAKRMCSSIALLHVVTDPTGAHDEERLRSEHLERLRATVSAGQHGQLHPEFLIEFGSVSEKVLEAASRWKADLVVLGVHGVEKEAPNAETTMAKASEIVRRASCPVLTTRLLHENAYSAAKTDSGAASA
jgi:nucleotide-binding universal stress UspA family protein